MPIIDFQLSETMCSVCIAILGPVNNNHMLAASVQLNEFQVECLMRNSRGM